MMTSAKTVFSCRICNYSNLNNRAKKYEKLFYLSYYINKIKTYSSINLMSDSAMVWWTSKLNLRIGRHLS